MAAFAIVHAQQRGAGPHSRAALRYRRRMA